MQVPSWVVAPWRVVARRTSEVARGFPRSPGWPTRADSIPGRQPSAATATQPTRLRLPRTRCCELEARWYTATVAGPAGRRTHRWGYSSVGRAFGWQPKGHRFEPGYLHQQFLARLTRATHTPPSRLR